MRITINKIAELANVSRGTVDKVINNRQGVSDPVRTRVKEIIEALDYQPNIVGKVLANQKNPKIIGVIVAPDYNPFVKSIKEGIERASQELMDFGIKIDMRILKRLDDQEELAIIEDFLERKVDAISLVAIESDAIKNRINEINIPVVTYNSDLPEMKKMCFVGQNHFLGGKTVGELLGKLMGERGKLGIITSSHHLLCHQKRVKGFVEYVTENYEHIEIAEIKENEDRKDLAFEYAVDMINKIEGLKGIYITGGGVDGVVDAVKVNKVSKKIKIATHDLEGETLSLIEEGVIDFSIGQEPFFQGYKPIKILSDYLLAGIEPENEVIETKIEIVIRSNL